MSPGQNTVGHSYRPKQAAELLGIGTATLWRWANSREGFPQPIRLSARCTVFPGDQLIAWRDAQASGDALKKYIPRPLVPKAAVVRRTQELRAQELRAQEQWVTDEPMHGDKFRNIGFETGPHTVWFCRVDVGSPTAEARARLIAAAPDLLAALRAVVSVADRKTVEFDLAHAAIARALGKPA